MKKTPVNMAALMVIVAWSLFIGYGMNYVALKYFRNYEYWFTYYAVEPIQPVFMSNEPLQFDSILKVDKETAMEWQDILRCRPWGTDQVFSRVSSYEDEEFHKKPTDGKITVRWTYQGKRPGYDAECKLHNTIIVRPKSYIKHVQQLTDQTTFRTKPL